MNKFNLLFVLVFVLFACTDITPESTPQPVAELRAEIVNKLSDQGIYDAWGITRTNNGQFIIRSSSGIVRVAGEQGVTLSQSATADKKSVLLYDFSRNKIVEYSAGQNQEMNTKIVKLPGGKQHLAAIKGQDFTISTGLYDEGRYLYTPNTGEAKYFVSYPEHSDYPDMAEKLKSILYASSVLRIRPDEKSFVCADMYSGTMDFCRIENGKIELVKRLCLHAPDIRIQGNVNPKVRYTKENLMGFTDVTVSEDRVYALHSGKSFRQTGSDFSTCEEVLVYDWDGNLTDRYKLPAAVTSIDYNDVENVIYAVENGTDAAILKIKLPSN